MGGAPRRSGYSRGDPGGRPWSHCTPSGELWHLKKPPRVSPGGRPWSHCTPSGELWHLKKPPRVSPGGRPPVPPSGWMVLKNLSV
jgi:rRNA maturation protein Nop10